MPTETIIRGVSNTVGDAVKIAIATAISLVLSTALGVGGLVYVATRTPAKVDAAAVAPVRPGYPSYRCPCALCPQCHPPANNGALGHLPSTGSINQKK